MSSLIDMVNDALAQIGEGPINAFTDGTTKADIANTHTPIVLRAMLYDHRWNFARVRVVLAADAAAPVSGFAYAYTLPGDCLRVWGIGDGWDGRPDTLLEWKREGNKILTDSASPLTVHYNRYTELPNEWSGAFGIAFSTLLASRFAGSIAHDAQLMQNLMNTYYRVLLPSALGANGQEGSQDVIESDDLLLVRDG